jgi:hypothetical protein
MGVKAADPAKGSKRVRLAGLCVVAYVGFGTWIVSGLPFCTVNVSASFVACGPFLRALPS